MVRRSVLIVLFVILIFIPVFVAAQAGFNVGDTGPAGGIVFYDKGNYEDGWRYLEAAPFNTETEAPWGAYRKNIPGTETAIGSGRQNTKIIAEYLNSIGETERAALICISLSINGYNDWFLPSLDELALMDKNLHKKGLGNFKDEWYLSSTQYFSTQVRGHYFANGGQATLFKHRAYRFRAIRAF